MSVWKSCPEAAIESTDGDSIKVSWSDLITVEIEATYKETEQDDHVVSINIDVGALPHLVLALQHCLDVARLEGCYDKSE